MEQWFLEIVREPGDPAEDAAALAASRHTWPDPDTGGPGDANNTLVIGETQEPRVNDFARDHGLTNYAPSDPGDERGRLERQARFIRGIMDAEMRIVDIGPDVERRRYRGMRRSS